MSFARNRPNFGAISIVDMLPNSLNAHNRKRFSTQTFLLCGNPFLGNCILLQNVDNYLLD